MTFQRHCALSQEGSPGMTGDAGRVAVERLVTISPRPISEPFAMLELGVEGRRNIAEHLPVERRSSADLATHRNERAEPAVVRRRRFRQSVDHAPTLEHSVGFGVEVDLRAAIALDHQPGDVARTSGIAALGRRVGAEQRRGRAEALPQHDVHDPLVGAIAIFKRDFLGQDLDALDRLGRNVAELAEARNPLAIEEQHRLTAAAAARAPISGASASSSSLMLLAPVARMSPALRVLSGGMSPTTDPRGRWPVMTMSSSSPSSITCPPFAEDAPTSRFSGLGRRRVGLLSRRRSLGVIKRGAAEEQRCGNAQGHSAALSRASERALTTP